jgi:hypothetical protein
MCPIFIYKNKRSIDAFCTEFVKSTCLTIRYTDITELTVIGNCVIVVPQVSHIALVAGCPIGSAYLTIGNIVMAFYANSIIIKGHLINAASTDSCVEAV